MPNTLLERSMANLFVMLPLPHYLRLMRIVLPV
nr:MAG TPA: hypothetical protein [Caudoviricetes sp.]